MFLLRIAVKYLQVCINSLRLKQAMTSGDEMLDSVLLHGKVQRPELLKLCDLHVLCKILLSNVLDLG